ncbi:HepT-like ribonuclease domain-containing protein [Methanolacinia petrolearia]|uniref:HepT-like ribonuclease domain-containing protein n=1 Tax=Methanolacinia petrolearia TaxID=54120 RepID=UPI00068B8E70|nr:HepT-like ribonuclease domain-containing protein [Methanolacinia petrolearia]
MNRDRMFICHIRDEIEFLSDATESLTYEKLDADKIMQHVVQKSLEIIGEAAKNVSPELKAEYPEIH